MSTDKQWHKFSNLPGFRKKSPAPPKPPAPTKKMPTPPSQMKNLPAPVHEDEPWLRYIDVADKSPPKPQLPSADPNTDGTVITNVEELIHLALDVHYKILKNTPLNPADEDNYIANAKLVLATAQSVLGTQIKVDENQLRRRKQDDIVLILRELKDEAKKLASLEVLLEE